MPLEGSKDDDVDLCDFFFFFQALFSHQFSSSSRENDDLLSLSSALIQTFSQNKTNDVKPLRDSERRRAHIERESDDHFHFPPSRKHSRRSFSFHFRLAFFPSLSLRTRRRRISK